LKGQLLDREDWDTMLDTYYSLHGWSQRAGWPTREKLRELDLPECIERLEQAKQMYQPKA
jgi:aldehyde:ferredoxin oxidoreductase